MFKEVNGDWDIRISDLVKNPDGTDINPCGEFEVRRAELAKYTLLTSTMVPLGYFQIFYDPFRLLNYREGGVERERERERERGERGRDIEEERELERDREI